MVRVTAFLYILTLGWSVFRIGDYTVFDIMSVLMLPFLGGIWQRRGSSRIASRGLIRAALISGVMMILATAISAIFATDLTQHLMKGIPIALSLTLLVINFTMLFSAEIISPKTAVEAFTTSATFSSIVTIGQGGFGLFLGLMNKHELQYWMRATGLTEHPIECGILSGAGVVLSLLLIFSSGKNFYRIAVLAVAAALNIYSLTYSASLTAFLTLCVAVIVLLAVERKLAYLLLIVPFAVLMGIYSLANEDSRLSQRLLNLSESGSSYSTVEARESQVNEAISRLTPVSIIFGKSFDIRTSPQKLDIHNGIVGMDYYFGILGLGSQIYLIAAAILRIMDQRWLTLKAAGIGIFFLFIAAYMTGPTYSRRSQWGPLIMFAAMPLIVRNPGGRSRPAPEGSRELRGRLLQG